MPLKLRPPTPGKTPNWHVRGTHRGIYVERTAGTPDKRKAQGVLKDIRDAIERGDYPDAAAGQIAQAVEPLEPTFADAALAYLKAGGEPKYIGPVIELRGPHALYNRKLAEIDQILIDSAADALYPDATPQTRNRQFYTPVSAILKRAGVDTAIKRPKGWRGSKSTSWLKPEQAFRLFAEADHVEPEFGLLCRLLCYTGMRISEALAIKLGDIDLDTRSIYLPKTKNNEARSVYLTTPLVEALRAMPPRPVRPRRDGKTPLPNGVAGRPRAGAGLPFLERGSEARLFRYCAGGKLRQMLATAMKRAGLCFPRRQGGFHIFCHTYGTWMHRYGQLDTFGLTRTARWKDPRSADRYRHTGVSEEAMRADLLPTPQRIAPARGKSGESALARQKRKAHQ
jgi:integrase